MQKAIVLQDGGWDRQPEFDTTELNEHFAEGWRLVQAFPLITSAIKNIRINRERHLCVCHSTDHSRKALRRTLRV